MTVVREVVFHDGVVELINTAIAAYQPERGGILLGPIGVPVVSEFIPDPDAATTGSTYSPSQQVNAKVTKAAQGNIEVKGIVHSHPGSMDHPSSGDHRSFGNWMQRMPWIPFLITPIVTVGQYRRGSSRHKIALTNGELSVFIAEKRVNNQIAVMEAMPRVLPLAQVVAEVSAAYKAAPSNAPVNYVPIEGHPYASTTLTAPDGRPISVMVPYAYPLQPPLILAPSEKRHRFTRTPAETVAVPLTWDMNLSEEQRLAQALQRVTNVAPEQQGPTAPARELLPSTAAGSPSASIRAGLRARLDGSISSSVQGATVLIVGLGSGGSQTVETLARSSVENFVVIDPDSVEAANLSRSVYDAEDIGSSKCAAIIRRVQAINPGATVVAHQNSLDDFDPDALAALVDSVDYVVAATDDPDAQYRLNHVAWERGRPAVFAGVYERGAAGEIIYTIPGITSCFRCATAGRRGGRRGTAVLNYGTGTLVAEPALGADITHVVSASAKVLLGLIELSDPAAHQNTAASMVAIAAGAGRNYLQMSMIPEYDYFPQIFKGVRGQHAYQSVWLETRSAPDCPTCGEQPTSDTVDVPVNLSMLTPVANQDNTGSAQEHPGAPTTAEPVGTIPKEPR